MATFTFTTSTERAKEIEFCCEMCDCSKNEFLRVVIENWLEANYITEKLKAYEKKKESSGERY